MAEPKPLIGLPIVTFLYTLDQIAAMVNVDMHDLHYKYIYFLQRSTGPKPRTKMIARNIAPDDEPPDWRVSHTDFVRWLSGNGFEFSQPRLL